MVHDKNQHIGWAKEAVEETSPITTGTSKYWLLGKMTNDLESFNHPMEIHNWLPIYKATQKNPDELELQDTSLGSGFAFYPVNLISFYQVMGKCVTTTGVHEITNIDAGNVETFTTRSESLTVGAVNDKIFEGVGNKATMLSGYFDLTMGYRKMSQILQMDGIKTQTPSYNQKHTNGPRYPTDDGTNKLGGSSKTFGRDLNSEFQWDSSADDIDYLADLLNFTYKITNYRNISGASNQPEPENIEAGNFEYAFTATIKRGNDRSIRDDFDAKTLHDMYLTLYAGSTNYVKLSFADVGLIQCSAVAPHQAAKYRTWDVKGIAQNLVVTGVDDCSPSEFFGE